MLKHSQAVLALWQDFLAQLNAWLFAPQLTPIPIETKKNKHNVAPPFAGDAADYQQDYRDRY